VRKTGEVTVAGAEARAGMDLDAEAAIEVPDGGRAVIELRDGGRIELDGPARAILPEDAAAQLVLIRGAAFGAQPPAGNAPRPPLRIAAPAVSVEIGVTGEFYVATFESGAAWVCSLAGTVALDRGEADNRRHLRTLVLPPGRAVAVTDRLAEPTDGPGRLSAARAAAATLAQTPSNPVDPAAERAALESATERLDRALVWLETEARRGRELTNAHRDAVQQSDTEEASRLQRELVGHSQSLYRLRRLATSRWERIRAEALRLAMVGRPPAPDPVAQRRDRVAGLLGR